MVQYKDFITMNDTEIICNLCHRPTGMIVEDGDFIGVAICSSCFGRNCISGDEIQHAMDRVFDMLRMNFES